MRTEKELLIYLKSHIEKHGIVNGLCELIPVMTYFNNINANEAEILNDYFIYNLPDVKYDLVYCWPVSQIKPRLEWLNHQISKL